MAQSAEKAREMPFRRGLGIVWRAPIARPVREGKTRRDRLWGERERRANNRALRSEYTRLCSDNSFANKIPTWPGTNHGLGNSSKRFKLCAAEPAKHARVVL